MSRLDKVNGQLQKEVSLIIQQEMSDPRIKLVTITGADISPDLRHAKIFYSVLGNVQQLESAKKGLESARGMIRKYVGERVQMRYTPELMFIYDRSLEYGARIEETLKEIHDERKENHPDDQES